MRAVDRRAVQEALEAVDLADRAKDGTSILSGRAAAARPHRPRAGRPSPTCWSSTSRPPGSTSPARRASPAIIERLVARGTTILLVAHEMGPLAPLITRTVVMREGRIAYDGDPLGTFHDVPHAHAHHPPTHRAHDDYSPDVRGPLEGRRGHAAGPDRTHDREEPRR